MTLTGAGLKDPDFALSFEDKIDVVEPNLNAVSEVVES